VGQLEYRTLNKPAVALAHFEKYIALRPNGFLAETARAERVRVLQTNGEHRQAIGAAEQYISKHPTGFNLSEMKRRRADSLAKLNRCGEASQEYRQIISAWPGSKEAKRAQIGLDACN
jgi:TolA-binding protein